MSWSPLQWPWAPLPWARFAPSSQPPSRKTREDASALGRSSPPSAFLIVTSQGLGTKFLKIISNLNVQYNKELNLQIIPLFMFMLVTADTFVQTVLWWEGVGHSYSSNIQINNGSNYALSGHRPVGLTELRPQHTLQRPFYVNKRSFSCGSLYVRIPFK